MTDVKSYEKKVILTCRQGQWTVEKVEIATGAIPLTVIDVRRINRVVRLDQRKRISEAKLAKVISRMRPR
jgi:hypothetical protein